MLATSLFGALAWITPVLLIALAWRFLRHPDQNGATGRLAIGTAALVVSVLGLWHLAQGTSTPSDGADAMNSAGGTLGWIVTAPVGAALGSIVSGFLLVILGFFGYLVLTKTTIARLREIAIGGFGRFAGEFHLRVEAESEHEEEVLSLNWVVKFMSHQVSQIPTEFCGWIIQILHWWEMNHLSRRFRPKMNAPPPRSWRE